ncbi:LuxR C-terminal-related transcriptional regulator [Leifsonia sp. fls2-241-R2A-40a]|uniref:ATP-binding protein n=1 Tax=Leifsonia sp. fls2-241-R2A-40a TaxID=3040290 RepID=UPI00254ABD24|nr:LuxR C-terminal-related transcriptional regulator [Leifsonia sp. fls2-241-R2A-40a]
MRTDASPGAVGLPSPFTSMVGRRAEVARIRQLLTSTARLVTVVGTGAVGKSRIAIEAAHSLRRSHRDDIWFVDLEGGSLDVTATLIHDLRIPADSPRLSALTDALAQRDMLIVMDNCDRSVAEVKTVAEAVLTACPGVRFLATSRQPLGSAAEVLLPIEPFPSAGLSESSAAVQLFIERARQHDATFEPNADDLEQIIDMCEILQGVPLSIELAAAQMQFMDLRHLDGRLHSQLDSLRSPSAAAPSRSDSLRHSVAYSWAQCSSEERDAWACLSVLAPGWDLPFAEAVLSKVLGAGVDATGLVFDLLRKSIVERRPADGGSRYAMLPALREFGAEHLIDDEIAHRAQAETVRARLEEIEDLWFSRRQDAILTGIRNDLPNVRMALRYASRQQDGELALTLCTTAYRQAWQTHGTFDEYDSWVAAALATPAKPGQLVVEALAVRSLTHALAGRHALAAADLHAAREFDGPRSTSAEISLAIAAAHCESGDVEAIGWFRRAVELDGEHAFTFRRFNTPERLAHRLLKAGQWEEGEQLNALILEHCSLAGDRFEQSLVHSYTAAEWLALGEYERATEEANAALELKRRLHNPLGVAQNQELLAEIARLTGSPRKGAELLGSAAARWRDLGAVVMVAYPPFEFHRSGVESALRSRLGDETFDKCFRAGAGLDEEASIGFAVSGTTEHAELSSVPRSVLTPRETEVTALAADGMTNKAIGSQLFISTRTVEAHIQNALVKLGLRSRTELAVWYKSQTFG